MPRSGQLPPTNGAVSQSAKPLSAVFLRGKDPFRVWSDYKSDQQFRAAADGEVQLNSKRRIPSPR